MPLRYNFLRHSPICSLFVRLLAAYSGNQNRPESETVMTTPTPQPDAIFTTFIALLLDTLAKLVPGRDADGSALAARRQLARILFDAFKPQDALEAMLAARAIAAHCATMDGYTRAAQPDFSNETVISLRASAIAASRSFDAVLLTLEKRRKEARQQRAETAKTNNAARTPAAAQPAQPKRPAQTAPYDLPSPIAGLRQQITQAVADYRNGTALATTLRPDLATPAPSARTS
jgi:hypothetical protein